MASYIDSTNAGNYSVFNTANNYILDTFMQFQDIQASEKPEIEELQGLLVKASPTSNDLARITVLRLKYIDKIPNCNDWNKFCACLVNMQLFMTTQVQGYITTAQNGFNATLAKFSDKGMYDNSITYQQWNTLTYSGQTYRSKQDINLNHTPIGDITDLWWALTAKQGSQGIGIGLVPMGVYNNSTSYLINQLVSDSGSLYYCINPTTGNAPSTSPTYWQIFQANVAPVIQNTIPTALSNGLIWIDSSTSQNIMKYWNGTVWKILGNMASNIAITDAGNIIIATNVEDALQEITGSGRTTETIKNTSDKIGVLSNLTTTDKSNLVNAVSEVKTQVNSHLADKTKHIPYITTTNSGNTYSAVLGLTSLVDGQPAKVKCNADSTGNVLLNPDGLGNKSVVKANGVAVTNWKANGIYTMAYNITTGNFILQGEGGSGDAIASDLLLGKKASTDAGDIVGTKDLSNLLSSNILNGVSIGGVTGNVVAITLNVGDATVVEDTTVYTTKSTSPVQFGKKITMLLGGNVRIKFSIYTSSTAQNTTLESKGQIYKNGVAVGTIQQNAYNYAVAFSQDFSCVPGDYFQIYMFTTSATYTTYLTDFQCAFLVPAGIATIA